MTTLKDMSKQARNRLVKKIEEERGCMEYTIKRLMDDCISEGQRLHLVFLKEAFTIMERAEQHAEDIIQGIQNDNGREHQRSPFWKSITDIQDEGVYIQKILKLILEENTNSIEDRHHLRLLQREFKNRITWNEQLTEYL
jgi:hypothetical protein